MDPIIRFVKIKPIRVAVFHATGKSPEPEAYNKMKIWADLKGLLKDYLGDDAGLVELKGTIYSGPGILKKAENDLLKLVTKFNEQNKQRRREGKPPKDLDKLPETQAAILEAKARLDIVMEEVDELKKRLANFVVEEKFIEDGKVLQHGLQGSSVLELGGTQVIDGQRTSFNADGKLFFDDPRSPYNQLSCEVYYSKLVPEYQRALKAKKRELFEEALKNGKILPPFCREISNARHFVMFPKCPPIDTKPKPVEVEKPETKKEAIPVAKSDHKMKNEELEYLKQCCPILLRLGGSMVPKMQAAKIRELRLIRKMLPRNHSSRMRAEYNFSSKDKMSFTEFKKRWVQGWLPGYDGI